MRGSAWRWTSVAVIACAFTLSGHGEEPKVPKKPDPRAVKELMRRKLELAQQLLASLTINDMDRVARDADALAKLRREATFRVVSTKQYETWSDEFGQNVDDILRAAKAKNVETAKLKYLNMTLTCFNCHTYVRDLGDVRAVLNDH